MSNFPRMFPAYFRWTILVGLNTIVSLLFSVGIVTNWQEAFALVLGIITFVITYVSLDRLLLQKGFELWRSALQAGVIISACLYLIIPFIPIGTGAAAIELVNGTLNGIDPSNNHAGFMSIYFIVIVDGLLLSMLAMLPVIIVYSISLLSKKNKSMVKP